MAVGKVKWGNLIGLVVVVAAVAYGGYKILGKAETQAVAPSAPVQEQVQAPAQQAAPAPVQAEAPPAQAAPAQADTDPGLAAALKAGNK